MTDPRQEGRRALRQNSAAFYSAYSGHALRPLNGAVSSVDSRQFAFEAFEDRQIDRFANGDTMRDELHAAFDPGSFVVHSYAPSMLRLASRLRNVRYGIPARRAAAARL